MAFSKKRANDRKTWIGEYQEGTFLDSVAATVQYKDFVHKELVLFSKANLRRSIPSLVDGLKVTQRKIIFACLKKKLYKDMKVSFKQKYTLHFASIYTTSTVYSNQSHQTVHVVIKSHINFSLFEFCVYVFCGSCVVFRLQI